ncbi:MAG: hypothetical protein HQK70_13095, partial [Desulfamplus sp.]|nr:hypothetical protein [Desulfamplus sp.]
REIAVKEANESIQAELKALKNRQNFSSKCSCDDKNYKSVPPAIKTAIIFFIILAIIVIKSSFDNNQKYYLYDTKKGLEIWQGDFAPMSKSQIAFLEGLDIPDAIKSSYNQQEVFSIPFNYYLDKTDALVKSGPPFDFNTINNCIYNASKFISNNEDKDIIAQYIQNIRVAQSIIQSTTITIPSRTLESEDAVSVEEQKSDLLDHSELLNNMDSKQVEAIEKETPEAVKKEKAPETEAKPEAVEEEKASETVEKAEAVEEEKASETEAKPEAVEEEKASETVEKAEAVEEEKASETVEKAEAVEEEKASEDEEDPESEK